MMPFRRVLLLLALFCLSAHGQYTIRSPYLAEPERVFGYVDSCAAFWAHTVDPVRGGYYTNIDRSGKVITAWGKNKNMITQSRHAYGFVRAYMLTGNDIYLDAARLALDFMYAHAWDKTWGGWHNELDENGKPLSATAAKTAFNQHYALLGPCAFVEATAESLDGYWLQTGLTYNESRLWDSDPVQYGYYDQVNFNASTRQGKSFNATVDAVTTHQLSLFLMTGDPAYQQRLQQLTDNMVHHLHASMAAQKIGFAEAFDTHWNPDPAETMTIMGHVLKTAWCLGRLYQLDPQPDLLETAESLAQHVLQKGYDHTYGGPYKDYNRVTGQMLMWGQVDTAKAWWQMEQAVTAGLMLYDITRQPAYLQMADETLDFFMRHFVDRTYGEVYENRTRYGGPIWGDHKGGGGKAGYHSIELGYYVYLYGTLFVHNRPVQLHYRFAPAAKARTIALWPLAIPTARLAISQVLLDEQPYAAFDPVARTLFLPAGTGGHFAVTFTPQANTNVARRPDAPEMAFELLGNYPNPFNARTQIAFQLNKSQPVRIVIHDLRGREMGELCNRRFEPGRHNISWEATGVPSGIYYYRLHSAQGTKSGKLTLLR